MSSYSIGSKQTEVNISDSAGTSMHALATQLCPINRSITGDGVRQTLLMLGKYLRELQVYEIPSGTTCFDWTVPREWRVRDAWIKDAAGNKVVDFAANNLHLIRYSTPAEVSLSLNKISESIGMKKSHLEQALQRLAAAGLVKM